MALDTIGKYQIRRELGRGGMAAVYEAYDPTFERLVALKVLSAELLHDVTFRTRFEREAKTIAALEHPAIVPVYDYGEANGRAYLAMRYMSGGSLADKRRGQPLTGRDIVSLFERIGPALDRAHAKGVVHRDLKPANILYDDNGEPYVGDFGIAKLTAATNTELTQGGAIGTPSYMSPEQARGEAVDGRTDLYAIGVMLFELLTGALPYASETPTGMMMKHILDPIPRLAAFAPALPPAWQAVIDRAMAKRREDRYPNMATLTQDVRAIVDGQVMSMTPPMMSPYPAQTPGTPARPMPAAPGTQVYAPPPAVSAATTVVQEVRPPTPPRPMAAAATPAAAPRAKRSPFIFVGLGVLACTALSVGAYLVATQLAPRLLTGAAQPPTVAAPTLKVEPTAAPTPAANPTTPVATTAATAAPTATRPAPSATPTRPASIGAATIKQLSQLRTFDASSDNPVRWVNFGPDGAAVLAAIGNGSGAADPANRLQTWRIGGTGSGSRLQVLGIPWSAAIHPDGRAVVVAAGKAATLYRVGETAAQRTIATRALDVSTVAFSRDGKYLAVGGPEAIGRTPIQVFNTDGWTKVSEVDNGYNMSAMSFSPDGSLLAASNATGQITVWRVSDGRRVMSYKADANYMTIPLTFSDDGRYFVSAGCGSADCAGGAARQSEILIWRTSDWSLLGSFVEPNNAVEALAFSPNGEVLFIGGRASGRFVTTAEIVTTLKTPTNAQPVTLNNITSADFSPDGRFVVIGTSNSGVHLWGVP
ncbi:MAG: protein kinase [Thermoflexales bacterium]|nr:protein kinase [Thermoflexales bacterium]